eukprot:8685930-Pyramimonas_sp.AAC.1
MTVATRPVASPWASVAPRSSAREAVCSWPARGPLPHRIARLIARHEAPRSTVAGEGQPSISHPARQTPRRPPR